jgi:hypothetical protein
MQNFSSLVSTQTDLDKFLKKIQGFFRKTLKRIPKNSKSEYNFFLLNLAKHVNAKFQHSSLYPDGLRQFFYLFSRKIQDFLKEHLEFFKSEISSE